MISHFFHTQFFFFSQALVIFTVDFGCEERCKNVSQCQQVPKISFFLSVIRLCFFFYIGSFFLSLHVLIIHVVYQSMGHGNNYTPWGTYNREVVSWYTVLYINTPSCIELHGVVLFIGGGTFYPCRVSQIGGVDRKKA